MKEILLYIVEGLISVLLTVITAYLIPYLINKYSNDKNKKMLLALNDVISNGVKNIYQTFVQEIKGTDKWTKETQEEALKKCYLFIQENLTEDLKNWLNKYSNDIEAFIKGLIEAEIYSLKAINSKTVA